MGPIAAPAARVSAANALLDRGYGKPPQHQHITGEDGPRFVALLPEPCKTVEEWEASLGDLSSQPSSSQRSDFLLGFRATQGTPDPIAG